MDKNKELHDAMTKINGDIRNSIELMKPILSMIQQNEKLTESANTALLGLISHIDTVRSMCDNQQEVIELLK